MTLAEEVREVQQEAAELQANLNELMRHRQERFVKWQIVTYFRDPKGEQYKPLSIDKHRQSVMDRAVLEGTLRGLNYKNWDSLGRAAVDLVQGLHEDDRKMAMLLNQFQSLSRVLRLLGEAVPPALEVQVEEGNLTNGQVAVHTMENLELPSFEDEADMIAEELAARDDEAEPEPEFEEPPEPEQKRPKSYNFEAVDEDDSESDEEALAEREGGE